MAMKNNRVWHWVTLMAVCAATMTFVGCTTPSIFHTYKINDDEATSILIDAKQRAILAVPALPEKNGGAGNAGKRKNGQKRIAS